MAAAPAAEELPVLTYLYLVLISFLMWALFRGLKGGWNLTLGGVLTALGSILNYDYRFIHIHFGGPILALNAKIVNGLTEAAAGYEHAMGFWFWQMADLQLWIVDQVWKTTKDLAHWGNWVVGTYVPAQVQSLKDLVHPHVQTATKVATKAGHAAAATARTVTIPHLGEIQWLHKHWKQLTSVVAAAGAIAAFPPIAIPRIWRGIDQLKDRLSHHNKRLHKLEALTGATAFAALMANALGLGRNWRCVKGPVGRTARRLCGMDQDLLTALLLGTGVVASLSVREIAEDAEALADEVFGILSRVIDEFPARGALALDGQTFPH